MDNPPPKPWVPSGYYDAAVAVTATIPAVPAVAAALALGGATAPGLYIGILLLFVLLSLRARKREEKRREWEQEQRDVTLEEAAERRHEEVMTGQATLAHLFSTAVSAGGVLDKVGLGATRLARIVEATGRAAGRAIIAGSGEFKITGSGAPEFTIALSGTGRTTPSRSHGILTVKQADEASELLQGITDNPPTTPEAAAVVAEQIEVYLPSVAAVGSVNVPEVTITGAGAARLAPAAAVSLSPLRGQSG